jgi:hypothetical protein
MHHIEKLHFLPSNPQLTTATVQIWYNYSIMVTSLVMEEAGVPGENHRPLASNW